MLINQVFLLNAQSRQRAIYLPVFYQERCKYSVHFFPFLLSLFSKLSKINKENKKEKMHCTCIAHLQRSWCKTGRYETNLKMHAKFDRPITLDWVDIFL